MPPLMLTQDEATAVVIDLAAGERAGIVPRTGASAAALAKVRRVLPATLRPRLEALLATVAFTAVPRRLDPGGTDLADDDPTDTHVLLTVAEGADQGRPVEIDYTDRRGRTGVRAIHPHGVVGHAGHWYVVATDPGRRARRTFRLDRITGAALLPGSFVVPGQPVQAADILETLARTPWRHRVSVLLQGDPEAVRRGLPPGLAVLEPVPDDPGWVRARIRAERLDWVPALIASLDLPFVVEEPDELRALIRRFAQRLHAQASDPDGRPDIPNPTSPNPHLAP